MTDGWHGRPARDSRDLLPDDAEFDAAQFALHGLLSRYLGTDPADVRRRADDIITNWRTLQGDEAGDKHSLSLRSLWSSRMGRWAAGGAGLAAAACLLLWATLFRQPDARHAASANPVNAIGSDPQLILFRAPPAAPEAQALRDRIRDQMRAVEALKHEITAGPLDNDRHGRIVRLMNPWVEQIRAQRDLGDFADALENARAALDYVSGGNPAAAPIDDWQFIVWDHIGSIQAAVGDYPAASDAFTRSIALRKERIARLTAADDPDGKRHVAEILAAGDLPPLYWRLSYLALLQGNPSDAWKWQREAETVFRDCFLAIGRAANTPPTANLALIDCFRALPQDFQAPKAFYSLDEFNDYTSRFAGFVPNAGHITKLKSHFIREARLLRLDGRFEDALRTLAIAQSIPCSDCHDEDHLGFFLAVEAARAALMANRIDLALQAVEQARKSAAPTTCPDNPGLSKPALTGLRLLELDFLQAAALLAYANAPDAALRSEPGAPATGETPASSAPGAQATGPTPAQSEPGAPATGPTPAQSEPGAKATGVTETQNNPRLLAKQRAQELLEQAFEKINQTAATLPPDQQQKFRNQFTEWQAMLDSASHAEAKERSK